MPKTWFITGASRGLGAEIVRAAVRAGDQVIAGARNPKAIPDKLGRNGDQVLSVELDVTDASAACTAVDAALSRFGAIDVLVNNAGYGHYGFFEESTIDHRQHDGSNESHRSGGCIGRSHAELTMLGFT
jgi:NAD(P)-dependent dehydrogenase (short-subunit alcohol dehydrogenase family)